MDQENLKRGISGIYRMHWVDGRFYIGQAKCMLRRKREHLREMREGLSNHKVLNAFLEIGEPIFEVVEKCSVNELNNREQFYLDKYFSDYGCCNVSKVCDIVMPGYSHDKIALEKISAASKKKIFTPEYREKLRKAQLRRNIEGRGVVGYRHTEEARLKMSMQRKGKKKTLEHRARIGDAHRGEKNYNFGRKISEEAKKKASLKLSLSGNPKARKVINTNTGQVFGCVKEVSNIIGIKYRTLLGRLKKGQWDGYCYIN